MPGSDYRFANSSGDAERRFDSPKPDAPRELTGETLDAVLRETAAEYLAGASENPATAPGLLQVARKHSQREIGLDPIVVDLVEAVLAERLEISPEKQKVWRPVVAAVAQTLWEDAASRTRLARLWHRLHEALE